MSQLVVSHEFRVLAWGIMVIPDYQKLMLPVLKVAALGEATVPHAAELVADELGLNAQEREIMLPSGKQRLLHNRIHWAKFYMVKAGLITIPRRGIFIANQKGRDLLATGPASIDVDLLKTFPEFLAFYTATAQNSADRSAKGVSSSSDITATPEEQIDSARRILSSTLRAELLDRILEQSPAFFERLIVELLVSMGYGGTHESAARSLGKTGDGGIDGIVDEDRLGLNRIFLQAKRYAPHVSVGRPEVQSFVGSLVGLGATKGIFVTTSTFSTPAHEFVRGLQQRVILIDGSRLTELMEEFGVGVRVSRTVEVKRLDEDFFSED